MDQKMMREIVQEIKSGLDDWSAKLGDDEQARTIYDAGVGMHNALLLCCDDDTEPGVANALLAQVITTHSAVTDVRFMRGVSTTTQKVAVAMAAPVDQIVAVSMVSSIMSFQTQEEAGE